MIATIIILFFEILKLGSRIPFHIFCLVETPSFRVERKQDLFLFLLNVIIIKKILNIL